MIKIHAILLLLCAVNIAVAMDVEERPRAYEGNRSQEGELISATTLPGLAKKYAMPADMKVNLKLWFAAHAYVMPISQQDSVNTSYKDVIARFAALPLPLSKFADEGAQRSAILEKLSGARSKSFNYVFHPLTGYKLYVTGLGNRLNTLMSGQELSSGAWMDPYGNNRQENLSQDPNFLDALARISTHHMPGMFANYLLLKKYIQQNNVQHVVTPAMYLKHIPGTAKGIASDDNYCVLQEVPTGELLNLEKDSTLWSKVSDQALRDLFAVSKAGFFWNLRNNLVINDKGQFIILELEQPNNSDPRAFFNKKMVEGKWGDVRGARAAGRYAVDGMEAIKNIIVNAQKACEGKDEALWNTLEQKRLL